MMIFVVDSVRNSAKTFLVLVRSILCKTSVAMSYTAGAGQHYCVSCARHFISKDTLERHQSSKPHKRRLKEALKTPFTEVSVVGHFLHDVTSFFFQRDSLLAAEMTVDEPHRRVAADDVML